VWRVWFVVFCTVVGLGASGVGRRPGGPIVTMLGWILFVCNAHSSELGTVRRTCPYIYPKKNVLQIDSHGTVEHQTSTAREVRFIKESLPHIASSTNAYGAYRIKKSLYITGPKVENQIIV
jgi:hypothetical protein